MGGCRIRCGWGWSARARLSGPTGPISRTPGRRRPGAGLTGVLVTPGPDLAYFTGYHPVAITERITMLVLQQARPGIGRAFLSRMGCDERGQGVGVRLDLGVTSQGALSHEPQADRQDQLRRPAGGCFPARRAHGDGMTANAKIAIVGGGPRSRTSA
jgi:hypothetical protein